MSHVADLLNIWGVFIPSKEVCHFPSPHASLVVRRTVAERCNSRGSVRMINRSVGILSAYIAPAPN